MALRERKARLENIGLIVMVGGILLLIQPVALPLYTVGFPILLVGFLFYTVVSHF